MVSAHSRNAGAWLWRRKFAPLRLPRCQMPIASAWNDAIRTVRWSLVHPALFFPLVRGVGMVCDLWSLVVLSSPRIYATDPILPCLTATESSGFVGSYVPSLSQHVKRPTLQLYFLLTPSDFCLGDFTCTSQGNNYRKKFDNDYNMDSIDVFLNNRKLNF